MNTTVPPPGWWNRNWKWFLPVLIATGLALLAGFVLAIAFFVMRMISGSEPYQTALSRARGNAQVIAALGEPLEPGVFTMGNIATDGSGGGEANFAIPLHGPRGKATLHVEARRSADQWDYATLMVVIPARDLRVDLRTDAAERQPDSF